MTEIRVEYTASKAKRRQTFSILSNLDRWALSVFLEENNHNSKYFRYMLHKIELNKRKATRTMSDLIELIRLVVLGCNNCSPV